MVNIWKSQTHFWKAQTLLHQLPKVIRGASIIGYKTIGVKSWVLVLKTLGVPTLSSTSVLKMRLILWKENLSSYANEPYIVSGLAKKLQKKKKIQILGEKLSNNYYVRKSNSQKRLEQSLFLSGSLRSFLWLPNWKAFLLRWQPISG